jgi:hypothetical protein
MRAFLTDHLTAKNGLCATYGDPQMVSDLLNGHQSGAVDASDALWTLLSAEVWYQSVYLPLMGAVARPSNAEPRGRSPLVA